MRIYVATAVKYDDWPEFCKQPCKEGFDTKAVKDMLYGVDGKHFVAVEYPDNETALKRSNTMRGLAEKHGWPLGVAQRDTLVVYFRLTRYKDE